MLSKYISTKFQIIFSIICKPLARGCENASRDKVFLLAFLFEYSHKKNLFNILYKQNVFILDN